MTIKHLLLTCALLSAGGAASGPLLRAQTPFVNLTPLPRTMTATGGTFTLPASFAVGGDGLPADVKAELRKFADNYRRATGADVRVTDRSADAAVTVRRAAPGALGASPEAYRLTVAPGGVTIEAAEAAGFFYAFASLNKMLPPNVAAGVRDEKVTAYTLPCVTVDDAPRFPYRGFMLDVARHFFSVDEIKRMLDLMAVYKLNKFHFHLTEDQGWRWEVKKYPRLTSVGAVASNTYVTSKEHGAYWTNRPYGPYYYTREQLKDIVAYAAARHIEVIPEIDMPGHFSAAMAAYPEFSCTPDGPHRVETWGGVYTDVLNVADPKAVRFVKDILDELMEIFPSENIHIGGDECPTAAWEKNAACQALYKRLGLTSYRQLQTHFISEINDYIRSKGRKIAVWNETVTERGADLSLMKKTGATVFCWIPARRGAQIADSLGLPSVYTVYGPYYINRAPSKQGWMATLPGNGSDHLKATYEDRPTDFRHSIGVQGTFWTEHVATRDVMEHLALPRLIAIAEAGWSPETSKNFESFVRRMRADTVMLNYNNYDYDRAFLRPAPQAGLVLPRVSTAADATYYRIVTRAGDADRKGRCMTLLTEGHPLIDEQKGKGAAPYRLWTAPRADAAGAADAQLWRLEADPAHPERFALVCKAAPEGSLAPRPTAVSVAGRWTYDRTAKHYDFILGDKGFGTADGYRFYTIRSAAQAGQWLNASMPGQGRAVNLYTDPAGGNGGLWTFEGGEKVSETPVPEVAAPAHLPRAGKNYLLRNTVEGFDHTLLSDDGRDGRLQHTAATDNAGTLWQLTDVTPFVGRGGTFTFRLRNTATSRCVGAAETKRIDRYGYPVGLSAAGVAVTATYRPATDDYTLAVGGKSLFPVSARAEQLAGTVSSGSGTGGADAVRPQGTGWQFVPARTVTFTCRDTKGRVVATLVRHIPAADRTLAPPVLEGYRLMSTLPALDGTEAPLDVALTFKKVRHRVFLTAIDENGALLACDTLAVPVGESFVLRAPSIPFYTVRDFPAEGLSLTPEDDVHRTFTYAGTAHTGVAAAGEAVGELRDGMTVLLFDTSTADPSRAGYRQVIAASGRVGQGRVPADGADPMYVWQLRRDGDRWRLFHPATGLWLPELPQSGTVTVGPDAGRFAFKLNRDGRSWRVQGTNGQWWDGVQGGMTGWHTFGHAYELRAFRAAPYFRLTVRGVDDATGAALTPERRHFVKAGTQPVFEPDAVEGYTVRRVEGVPVGADGLTADAVVTVHYATPSAVTAVRTSAAAATLRYDLSGRPVAPDHRGIVLSRGAKSVLF